MSFILENDSKLSASTQSHLERENESNIEDVVVHETQNRGDISEEVDDNSKNENTLVINPFKLDLDSHPSDHRKYRLMRLDNGLIALLIENDRAKESCAHVQINAGHDDNPDEVLGLAHFLEHMLFMGTRKYPNENEYRQFIETNSGETNAQTGDKRTECYFEIDEEQFEPALNRFVQFFREPLFDANAVARELNAIHSEFDMYLKDESWRFSHVLKLLQNPDHPGHRFFCGNKNTLQDPPIIQKIAELLQQSKNCVNELQNVGKLEASNVKEKYEDLYEKSLLLLKAWDNFFNIELEKELKEHPINERDRPLFEKYQALLKTVSEKLSLLFESLHHFISLPNSLQQFFQDSIFVTDEIHGLFKELEMMHEKFTVLYKMKEFYKKYYRADQMMLVMQADLPLDTLEGHARTYFLTIPKPTKPLFKPKLPLLYKDNIKETRLQIESYLKIDSLSLSFVLQEKRDITLEQATNFIIFLLSVRTEGSLFHVLQNKKLINSINAAGSYPDDQQLFFSIDLGLTELGMQNQEQIIAVVFQYLAFLKSNGIDEKLFHEIQEKNERELKFNVDSMMNHSPTTFLENLRHYPLKNFFIGSMILKDTIFPKALILKTLEQLTPDQLFLIRFQSEPLDSKAEVEFYTQTRYRSTRYRADLKETEEFRTLFKLPSLYDFLPSDFSIRKFSGKFGVPRLISDDHHQRVWLCQDKFNKPKINLLINLMSNLPSINPINSAHAILFNYLLSQDLNKTYGVSWGLAGCKIKINITARGIQINIIAYSHKHDSIVRKIIEKLKGFEIDEKIFDEARKLHIDAHKNVRKGAGLVRCAYHLKILLDPNTWNEETNIETFQSITMHSFQEFIANFLKSIKLELICHGNILPNEALLIAENISNILKLRAANYVSSNIEWLDLPPGSNFKYFVAKDEAQPDNAILLYLQAPEHDPKTKYALILLHQLMNERLFHQLRDQEQLGYQVDSSISINNGYLSIKFSIASAKFSVVHLVQRLENFIERFKRGLINPDSNDGISDEELSSAQKSLNNTREQNLTNFSSPKKYFSLFMERFTLAKYNFNAIFKERHPYHLISRETLINLFNTMTKEGFERRLLLHTEKDPKAKIPGKNINDPMQLKQTKSWLPGFTRHGEQYIQALKEANKDCRGRMEEGDFVEIDFDEDLLDKMAGTLSAKRA